MLRAPNEKPIMSETPSLTFDLPLLTSPLIKLDGSGPSTWGSDRLVYQKLSSTLFSGARTRRSFDRGSSRSLVQCRYCNPYYSIAISNMNQGSDADEPRYQRIAF
jgi:hypothetical protein